MRLLLDLLLPSPCVVCGSDRGPVCRACAGRVWDPRRRDPTPRPAGLPPVWASGAYDGALQSLVLAYKEHACWPAVPLLCRALVQTVLAATDGRPGPVLLVPVPASAAARRRRGHHHVLALCRRAVRDPALASYGIAAPLLFPRRVVADQRGLQADARRSNLAGSMGCRPPPARWVGLPCVVVDDVVTTGSTAVEASRALREAGLSVVAVVALAATARQRGGMHGGMRGGNSALRFSENLATADDRD